MNSGNTWGKRTRITARIGVAAAVLCFGMGRAHGVTAPDAAPSGAVVKNQDAGWMWYGMVPYENTLLPDGAAHAGGPGTYAMYTFQGGGVDVYGMRSLTVVADGRSRRVGKVKVSIDDKEQGVIDLGTSADQTDYHYKMFSVTGLAAGNHVLQLDPVGGWIVVDSLVVAPAASGGGGSGERGAGDPLSAHLMGYWPCDEGAGTALKDKSGHGHHGSLMAGAAWAADGRGGGASLAFPQPGGAEISDPMVDTSSNFTVAAWVKLNDLSKYQTFVSIDGVQKSGFFLQYTLENRRFSFTLDPGRTYSLGSAQVGVWYYLVGVYDAKTRTSTLYMNGEFQNSSPVPAAYRALGHTVIGRAKFVGNYTDFVNGSIAGVRLYDTNLSASEVMDLYVNGH